MDKNNKLHDSSNDEKTSSNDENFVTPNKGGKDKKDNLDKNKLDRIKNESGDDNMELTKEKNTRKDTLKSMLDKISNELPVAKEKDGIIILDKNNPDDIEWWNDED